MDEGSIEEFNVADVKQVSTTEPISGFGRAVITVTADASNTNNAEKTINVFVLGPLIIIR